MDLSRNARQLPGSGIRRISAAAATIPDALHLEIGQPDIAPPPEVLAAADHAARAGHTGYAANGGLPRLRHALAAPRWRQSSVDTDQVVITNGGTQGIHLALTALLDPGDEVLIPDPGWPNYAMMAGLLGARPVRYPLRHDLDYQPRFTDLAALVGTRTKVLVLNSPGNPLGCVLDDDTLRALLALAEERGFWILSDECYDAIVFDSNRPIGARGLGHDDRLVTAHSFSKAYSMTGFRVGFVIAPPRVAAVLADMQEAHLSSINTPAQFAALAAWERSSEFVPKIVQEYRNRRDLTLAELTAVGIAAHRPDGAFYLWLDVREHARPTVELAHTILHRTGVALAPGSAFGPLGEGFLRLSLVAPAERLSAAVGRIADVLDDPGC